MMNRLQVLLRLIFVLALTIDYLKVHANGNTQATASNKDASVSQNPFLRSKNRQSRCVRCYEDRYYGSSTGAGPGGAGRSGGDSRSFDDRNSWYYPTYDRYDDRSAYRERDYDARYYGNYREAPPSRQYDRYDEYRRGAVPPASYDRGYGYDNRDRYGYDRYSDNYRDRSYYDRYRTGSAVGGSIGGAGYERYERYERDPYDHYYPRYDYRNYRPWDETYRGQSGFDNSGRGYYFASDEETQSKKYLPQYERDRYSSPCGLLVANCPYDNTYGGNNYDRGSTKVSSSAIDSSRIRDGHTSIIGKVTENKGSGKNDANGGGGGGASRGGWTYLNEQDKPNESGSSGSNSGTSSGSRERDPQSASFGGRPSRPLSGSYLFDRDSNIVNANTDQTSSENTGGTVMTQSNQTNGPTNDERSNGNAQE